MLPYFLTGLGKIRYRKSPRNTVKYFRVLGKSVQWKICFI